MDWPTKKAIKLATVPTTNAMRPVGGRKAQRVLGRRQGDVHDRRIQDHHQLGQTEDPRIHQRRKCAEAAAAGDQVRRAVAGRSER
jgi:hypothetical protein